jgi:endoglucanase
MRKMHLLASLFLLFTFVFTSCEKEVVEPFISVDPTSLTYSADIASDTVEVTMNGAHWEATSSQTWCTLSKRVSSLKEDKLIVSVSANTGTTVRTATITVLMDNNLNITINVTQNKRVYNFPDYSDSIPADMTGMTNTALILAANMYLGWNMGNSLEVPSDETAWGNPKATQIFIDSVKAAGFNTVRLPCAWDSHIDDASTCRLKSSWLARVKEVIDYCYHNNMYVILNIHWDGGWLENNPTYTKQDAVNAKQKAFWEQIAMYFRDYDEHLLFAGTNEVHSDYSTPTAENNTVQQSYNQTFVTAVRSTGGKNHYRNLVVQGYNTNIDHTVKYLNLPTDVVSNRTFVEVHYYSPWEFCGNESSGIYLWGTPYAAYGHSASWGGESYVVSQFASMKTKFVDNGYPVILGEYSAMLRTSLTGDALTQHRASRAYYFSYVTEQAKVYGLVPCYWDNGSLSNNGCGIFNRNTNTVGDRQALNGLLYGAGKGHYPY